jgi:hypothetical protein
MVIWLKKGFRPERTGYFSPMATPWENMKTLPIFFALKGQVRVKKVGRVGNV